MPLEIAVATQADVHIMALRGRLDSAGAPTLQESMDSVLGSGGKHVLVDCTELRYISSVGLGIFVSSGKSLQSAGGSLGFSGLNQHVRSVFEMVGFFNLFPVYSSREEALDESRQRGA